jgi:predicted small metal-binding protein
MEIYKKSEEIQRFILFFLSQSPLESYETIVILITGKGVTKMNKTINCKDMGSQCDFSVCARTEVEVFKEVLDHANKIHGMQEFSPEFYDKVRKSMKEGFCDLEDELCKHSECWYPPA